MVVAHLVGLQHAVATIAAGLAGHWADPAGLQLTACVAAVRADQVTVVTGFAALADAVAAAFTGHTGGGAHEGRTLGLTQGVTAVAGNCIAVIAGFTGIDHTVGAQVVV